MNLRVHVKLTKSSLNSTKISEPVMEILNRLKISLRALGRHILLIKIYNVSFKGLKMETGGYQDSTSLYLIALSIKTDWRSTEAD
jgi:hypothetical protein